MCRCRKFLVLMVASCAVVASLSLILPCSAADWPETYKFGSIQAMTGWGAYWGKVQRDAQIVAAEQINKRGDLPFKLQVINEDHATDNPVVGLASARKLINIDKVPWINSSWLETTIAINPICQQNKVVEMNAGGIGQGLIGLPWLHNTRLTSSQLVPYLVEYIHKDLEVNELAQLWRNDGTGRGQGNIATAVAKKLGMNVVFKEPYEGSETDFRSIIAKVKAKKPGAIMGNAMYGEHAGLFIRQAREAGVTVPIVINDMSPPVIEAAGEHLEGIIFGGDIWHPELDTPLSNEMAKAYVEWADYLQKPADIDQFAANYYELVYVLRDVLRYVIDNGGDPFDGQTLEDALMKVKFYQTLFLDPQEGKMELMPDGTCIKPMFVFRTAKDGKAMPIKTVTRPVRFTE